MKAGRAMALAGANLRRNLRGAVLGAAGVAVGVGCLLFFVALGRGVSDVVRTRVFPVDALLVEVVPAQMSLGGFLGGGKLDDTALGRLERIDGVAQALPKMSVRVSAVSRYDGDFFGQRLRMGLEVMAVGVDPRLVADAVSPGQFVDRGRGEPLPAIVSTRLLDIYNGSFAAQRKLPQLTPQLLTGFRFPIEFGRSYVSPAGSRVESGEVEVVGFSPRALLGGITVPLDAARRLNRSQGLDDSTYSSVVLVAGSADRVPAILSAVKGMGFDVDDTDQKLAEQVGWAVALVTAALGLLSLLVAGLAGVNIAHSFFAAVRERRREIGVLRAVGASRRDVYLILLAEAAFIGVVGGVLGVLGSRLAALVVDALSSRLLPPFPFKPESFFAFSPSLLALGFLLAIAASIVGAWPPIRSAARMQPVAALAE